MMNLVDRSAPLPLYHQLKQALMGEIRGDQLRPGDQLPTEAAIEERYGVSRSTIRQALNELVLEGHVERIQGKGTFVAPKRITHLPYLTSFSENMRSQGYTPSRRVVHRRTEDPPADVAAKLETEQPGECLYLQRTLFADGEPIGVADTWLPVQVLGGSADALDVERLERFSLYGLLQAPPIELDLHHGVELITPAVADAEHARLLEMPEGTPVLVVDRVSRDAAERVVESTRMVFDGNRYAYRVEMSRPGGPNP